MRSKMDYLLLLLKGAGMGAADVIPGVSGGTIAFISGIYEELVESIKSINIQTLRLLFLFRINQFITAINGWFLIAVFGGVVISIFSLARVMKSLLHNYPVMVWAFFFGLILASSIFVLRSAGRMTLKVWLSFMWGIAIAWFITTVSPATTPDYWWFVFICGAIGICAMILPGISGAFILLLLGKYQYIITAVSDLNIPVIGIFLAGAVIGLILFSKLLSWLLKRYHAITISILAGFMIGSLNKVWPWKLPTSTTIGAHGELITLTEKNVLPGAWEAAGAGTPDTPEAVALFLAGILLLLVLEFLGKKTGK
jgi:putative membrane protein